MKTLIFLALPIFVLAKQIKSTPTSINVQVASPTGTSALAKLAASMSSGQWADFQMGGLDQSLVSAGGMSVPSILTYASRGHWDPVHKKIQYAGTSHTGGAFIQNAGAQITYDDATNRWTRESYNWSSEDPGHSYFHTTLNLKTGDMFFRSFNSAKIYRKAYGTSGQSAWQAGVVANHPHNGGQVAGALEWYPELNGGKGGLVFADVLGIARSNENLTSWTLSGTNQSGNYDQWIAYAGGSIYWGGGTGSSVMYKMNAQGAVTQQPNSPMPAGPNDMGAVIFPHPNGSGLLLFQVSSNGAIHSFNGTSWSAMGQHKIGSQDFWVGTTIHEYGVILFIVHPNGSGAPYAKVFKP